MSDVVSEMENQDVMSSVRRKISTDKANGKNASSGVDKLVLTASLRVAEPNASPANAEQPDPADASGSAGVAHDQPDLEADAEAGAQMNSPEAEPEILGADKDDRDILTAESAGFAPGVMVDEDTLRDMISDIVRQELQGDLGERITRNVRKLVRREIHRTMVSNELT